jgi:subtilisin family serine protease
LASITSPIARALLAVFLLSLTVTPMTQAQSAAPMATSTAAPASGGAQKPPPGLDSRLFQLAQTPPEQRAQAAAARRVPLVGGDRVLVTIYGRAGDAAGPRSAAQAAGGQIRSQYRHLVEAEVPVNALTGLARNPSVTRVERPLPATTTVGGEALNLMNEPAWKLAGQTGDGVKVAIVDLGFQGYPALLGTELPATVDTSCNQLAQIQNGEEHGTAVAEIVHEVAPSAQLFLVGISGLTTLGNAVDCLTGKGVHVVNHSVGWLYDGPGDGSVAIVNSIVDTAIAGGILWVNSAGNSARNHWSGPWVDTNGNDVLEFAGVDETNGVTVNKATTITAAIRWSDPWGTSRNDYDLFLLDNTQNVVASSEWAQNGSNSWPTEWLEYDTPGAGTYYLQIRRYAASGSSSFDLITFGQSLEHQVIANSLLHPADSANSGMVTVGAINRSAPTVIESFSSQGPTTDNRIKPDLSGYDNTTSAVYGAWFGTSAASPHVAGAAAVLKGLNAGWTPSTLRAELQSRAIDLGATGPDNLFGTGRLFLGVPPALPTATPTASAVSSATPTAMATQLTPSATPTATPSATVTSNRLAGTVQDQRAGAASHQLSLEVSLFIPEPAPLPGAIPVGTPFAVTTDSNGAFLLSGIPVGVFDVRVRHPQGISVERKALSFGGGTTLSQDFGLLRTGDADQNDRVTASDFTVLKQTFGTSPGCAISSPIPNPCADLDANGSVTAGDFSLLKQNFGLTGPMLQ